MDCSLLIAVSDNFIADFFSGIRSVHFRIVKFMKKNILGRMFYEAKQSIIFIQVHIFYISCIKFFRLMLFRCSMNFFN